MRVITLTQGKFALVDDADFDLVSKFRWYAARYGRAGQIWYAQREHNKTTLKLHQFILGVRGAKIDHIDGDGLNNCRSNLRLATNHQNGCNRRKCVTTKTSRFKGVHLCGRRWRAAIRLNRKLIHLGYFDTEEEAATAYNSAAIRCFERFARLNDGL